MVVSGSEGYRRSAAVVVSRSNEDVTPANEDFGGSNEDICKAEKVESGKF